DFFSNWADLCEALPIIKGELVPQDEREAWEWLRNPLAPGEEESTFAALRSQLCIPDNIFFVDKGFGALGYLEQQTVIQPLRPGFYKDNNPIVRHTVLRHRKTLEEAGLLEKIGVSIH